MIIDSIVVCRYCALLYMYKGISSLLLISGQTENRSV